jgi:GTPase
VHLLDISDLTRDPWHDYEIINNELACFDNHLARRAQIVVVTKLDLPITRERLPEIRSQFAKRGISILVISAVTREGVPALIHEIVRILEKQRAHTASAEASPAESV